MQRADGERHTPADLVMRHIGQDSSHGGFEALHHEFAMRKHVFFDIDGRFAQAASHEAQKTRPGSGGS